MGRKTRISLHWTVLLQVLTSLSYVHGVTHAHSAGKHIIQAMFHMALGMHLPDIIHASPNELTMLFDDIRCCTTVAPGENAVTPN